MNRKSILIVLVLMGMAGLAACGGGNRKTTSVETIVATSGTPQSAVVGAAFAAPLVATVATGSTADSGVSVTFTAPANGASGTFASGATSATVMTSASGVAQSPAFTANSAAGSYAVTASATGAATPASFSLTNTAGTPASISATGGTPQSAAVGTAFTTALSATVLDSNSNPVSGAVVTFTAPGSSAAGGTFANGTNTATTNASGVATSQVFTANSIIGGPYTVTASVPGVSGVADFSLTNTAALPGAAFSFYATGSESDGEDTYSLAGAIKISSDGSITGEQDLNDADGFTFIGDQITSGSLVVDSTTGVGTLILNVPGDTNVGVGGVETFAVSFANPNHAIIMEFDGGFTSSGSMDLQTPLSAAFEGFSFALTGLDGAGDALAIGGTFQLNAPSTATGSITNGFFDFNNAGTVTLATQFTGSLGTIDGFGRGELTLTSGGDTSLPVTAFYYVVGPEVIRIIDMDAGDAAVGSAYGQGTSTNTFTNSALQSSAFLVQSSANSFQNVYSAAGQFSVTEAAVKPAIGHTDGFAMNDYNVGVGDSNEEGSVLESSGIAGSFYVTLTGYGQFYITNGGLQDVTTLGIYLVDPTLNISDPNNPSGGGGALVADMDPILVGTGIMLPQTDPAPGDFSGNYAFGAQVFAAPGGEGEFDGFEFDLVGAGTVTAGSNSNTLSGTGSFGDLFELITSNQDTTGLTFNMTATPDTANLGRYGPPFEFAFTYPGGGSADFNVVLYQVDADQLFMFEVDDNGIMAGGFEAQSPSPIVPATKTEKVVAKTNAKLKQ
jgi:hypothetical protein